MRERSSVNRGEVAAIAIAILGAGLLLAGCSGGTTAVTPAPASGSASASLTLNSGDPAPDGMLPLGPTKSANQPPAPCVPGVPDGAGVTAPGMYEALPADVLRADPQPGGVGEVVNYDWGGHRPVAADTLRVTVPNLLGTLRPRAARMRLVIAISTGTCFASWRATARQLQDYDGSQDVGGWALLGEGQAQTDATVIEGLPDGDWIVHVHLAFEAAGAGVRYSSESYVRVLVGGEVAVPARPVPAPDPAAKCPAQALTAGRPAPDVALTVSGEAGSTKSSLGTVSTKGSAGEPDKLPVDVVSMKPGSPFTIRTVNGSCGNDWSGLFFLAVPDSSDGPVAPLSGLPTNNGADPAAVTPPLVGAMNGLAPAQGEWLIGAMFWFGGPEATQYFWRVSVK
jgi:hypothetical protein